MSCYHNLFYLISNFNNYSNFYRFILSIFVIHRLEYAYYTKSTNVKNSMMIKEWHSK